MATSQPKKLDILAIIQGLQQTNPRVYEALKLLNDEVNNIYVELFPVQRFVHTALAPSPIPLPVDTFISTVGPNYIYLSWTSSDPNIRFYEIRRGVNWDTGLFITRTTTLSAVIDPLPAGSYGFMIKTLNSDSVFQAGNPTTIALTVNVPNSPALVGQVIDNNVLLFWTPPAITSFTISHYNVYRDNVFLAKAYGTFATFFEMLSNTYLYSVAAIDLAGNEGPKSNVSLSVNQPPDFELQDDFHSSFSGTKTDCYVEGGYLIVDVTTGRTWAQHFTDNAWTTIQNQLDAGLPIFNQPADFADVATYVEDTPIYDYGLVLNNFIVNILTTSYQVDGNTSIACQIHYKVNIGDAWTAAPAGFSAFIVSARYLKVTLTFTSDNKNSILIVTDLRIILNVKQEIDSGQVNALASDATGTVVNFNKAFLDVKSITAEVDQTEPMDVVVDFVDVPNPTSFKVYVYDNSGIRRNSLVYWKARGVI